jgi:hypothetical protein
MALQQLSIRATMLQHSTCATTDPGILATFLSSCSFLLIVQLHALLARLSFGIGDSQSDLHLTPKALVDFETNQSF